MTKKTTAVEVTVESCAVGIVSAYEHTHKAQSVGSMVAKAIAELFAVSEANGTFEQVFGNGKLGKENTPGSLKQAIDAKCAKMAKEKRDGIAKMLKVRLSEARKLHRLEGVPQKGEDIQAALKRYAKPAERAPRPEGNEKAETFSIPAELSAHDLAEAFSKWMAEQNAAKVAAVAKELNDMLKPAKPARQRKAS